MFARFICSIGFVCLLQACGSASAAHLGELRLRHPTAGTVERYSLGAQHLVVEVHLLGSVTDKIEVWLVDAMQRPVTEKVVRFAPSPSQVLAIALPMVDPVGVPLGRGCYAVRMMAYDSDGARHAGDSCAVNYGGPGSTMPAVQCTIPRGGCD